MLPSIYLPDFTSYALRMVNIKTKSDLLAIHLHDITCDPLVLNDYYTGKPYTLKQENNTLTAPGKDGQFGTDDDIILGKAKQTL